MSSVSDLALVATPWKGKPWSLSRSESLAREQLKAEFGATVFKSFKFRSRSILSPSPSRRACINSSRKSLLPLLAVPHAEKRVEIQLEIAH